MNFVFIDITVTVHIGRRRNECFKAPRGGRALSASIRAIFRAAYSSHRGRKWLRSWRRHYTRDVFRKRIYLCGTHSNYPTRKRAQYSLCESLTYPPNSFSFTMVGQLLVAAQIQRLLVGKRLVASPVAWRISRVEQAGQSQDSTAAYQ
jgi:hypothetical protein